MRESNGKASRSWMNRLFRAFVLSHCVSLRLHDLFSIARSEDRRSLTELIAANQVAPTIARACPLSETGSAVRSMQERHARGNAAIAL